MQAGSLDENAPDLVEAHFVITAVVIGDCSAAPALARRHSPPAFHSCGFSRLQSLPPTLASGRIVAGFRNAQTTAGFMLRVLASSPIPKTLLKMGHVLQGRTACLDAIPKPLGFGMGSAQMYILSCAAHRSLDHEGPHRGGRSLETGAVTLG